MFDVSAWSYFHLFRIIAALFVASGGSAILADEAAPKRVLGPWTQDLTIGPGMDASGRILRGCVFVGLDLRGANFEGAHLGGCELFQCDLRNASFKDAILTGLRWDECDVGGADFSGAVFNGVMPLHRVSASQVRITAGQLMSTRSYRTRDLSNCVFQVAKRECMRPTFDFRDADLRGAIFIGQDFRESDFTNATVKGAQFYMCKIGAKQLLATYDFKESRQLTNIAFGVVDGHIDLSRCNLYGSSHIPRDADLTDAIIRHCTLRPPISREQLESTKGYKEGVLRGVSFFDQDLRNIDFSGMDLGECFFQDCDFANADMEDAVISNVTFQVFRTSDLNLTLEQIKSTWNYKHGRMAGIQLPEELAKALEKEARATEEEPAAGESGEKTEGNE